MRVTDETKSLMQEISELKGNEIQSKQQIYLYRRIFEKNPGCVILLDDKGQIFTINSAARNLLGIDSENDIIHIKYYAGP